MKHTIACRYTGSRLFQENQHYRRGVPRSILERCARERCFLLAVVGGRLSEGINFSDGLCRCVAVVGLPYPNPSDPLLRARMARSSF